ncbi:hypothetical protein E8E95_00495 [Pseudomonas sp. BN414]|uniref:hypothetical protein n=1 Tax=Pseudomonas sp. BN414 TaxID=2567888 RepID=UPI0024579BED|nr:hypothetical protein [Pseudomonas sp. BN414]MDH4565163.1 hypothetical protein [Pseudomonas sp. BN414]
MDAIDLPVDVLVTALTSRLADLQCARVDTDSTHITSPQPQEGADRRALVAGHLLGHLESRLIDGSSEFVAISVVAEHMREKLPGLEVEEVRFCTRFLDVDREIRFQTAANTETRQTRAWSRLVRYHARHDRVKLSEAGRLFLKMLRHRRDWLYEDKHVEMLVGAIRGNLFDDVPRLCQEILSSLRLFSEQLTAIRESPSIHAMAQQYVQRRQHFTDMLKRALDASLNALDLLHSQAIQAELERFQLLNPNVAVSLSSLRRNLRIIHQATESLNRNWAGLLADLQKSRRQRLGVLRFDDILTHFLGEPLSASAMEGLLAGCCGWVPQSHVASVTSFIGCVAPIGPPVEPELVVFDDDPRTSSPNEQFSSWLKRHAPVLLVALQQGPIHLGDLLQSGQLGEGALRFDKVEDLAAVMGLYVVTDPLGAKVELEVTCGPDLQQHHAFGYHIIASDLAIHLRSDRKEIT